MNRIRRFFQDWKRDLAIAGAGAALGLVVVILLQYPEVPPPEPPPTKVTRAPAPDRKQSAVRQAPVVTGLPERRRTPVSRPDTSTPERDLPATGSERAAQPSMPAWQRFAARYPAARGHPMVALIIDDMGIDRKRSARAIGLRGPLTMSFLSYANDLEDQAGAARKAGHELLVHVPMEPEDNGVASGRNAIETAQPEDEIRRRLDWALGRFDGFVGINNHMGSRYTADPSGMMLVLAEIKRRGLLFVDSRTTPKSVARRLSRKLSVPFAERDVFIDDDPRPESIVRQLNKIVRIAREKKYVVAIGHPRDETLAALEKWLPTLYLRGFVLVPVSAIVRHRLEQG